MSFTRESLQTMRLESKEAKTQKSLEDKIEFIKSKILIENEYGNTNYTTMPALYEDDYLNKLVDKLAGMFVDCDIKVTHINGIAKANIFGYKGNRTTTINIDWSPLKKEKLVQVMER